MSDIFLSYASSDRERIRPLVNALQETGWSVFWDRTIPTGKTWRRVIGKEFSEARAMIVVWSEKSIESDWVQGAAEDGKRRQILFPVLLDQVVPPFGFGNVQAADLVGWDGSPERLDRLMSDLSSVLGPQPALETARKHEQVRAQRIEEERGRTKAEANRKAEEERAKKLAEARRETSPAELGPGTVFRDGDDYPEMVVIPAGKFTMGSSERQVEGPQRRSNGVGFRVAWTP